MTAKQKPRRKRVPPGTKIAYTADTPLADIIASFAFQNDYNCVKKELAAYRRDCEADNLDAYDCLAHVVATNWAVQKGTARLKTPKPQAEARHAEIAKHLAEVDGSAVAVSVARETKGLPGSSERTVYRVKKAMKAKPPTS